VGSERFFRSLLLLRHPQTRTGWSLIPLAALVALGVAAGVWGGEGVAWAGPRLARAAAWLRDDVWSWTGWRGLPYEGWVALAVGALVVKRVVVPRLLPHRAPGARRKAGWLRKHLPWALPWAVLVGVPELRPWFALWLALLTLAFPLCAALNHLFFYLPFLAATKTRAQARPA
jgi:hypothetical protein